MPTASLVSYSTPAADSIDARVAAMSLEAKIGQVLIVGLPGPDLSAEVRDELAGLHPGGYILYDRNVVSPAQVTQLNSDLQAAARANGDPALFLTLDQEGGIVSRLPETKGFTEFPGQMALAATGDVESVRRSARAMSAEMRAVGFNMDLTPDLDVNNNPQNPIIGVRSFGSDPVRAAELGVAFIEAMQAEGIAAVGKHFPGHGDTAIDSHVALPTVPHARERLESVEFVPFKAAIKARVAGIMSAHITFPAIDDTPGLPATLSSKVLTGLLRGEMGYDGVIMTDELSMGALGTSGHPVPQAAAEALAAGADILLLQSGFEMHRQVRQELVARLASGAIPLARLDDAVRRVLVLKQRMGILDGAVAPISPSVEVSSGATRRVGDQATRSLSREIAARAITLVRDEDHLIPLKPDTKLLVVETGNWALGNRLGATTMQVPAQPQARDITSILSVARDGRTVVVATSDVARNKAQADLVNALVDAHVPLIVVAVRSPYDILYIQPVPTYLATYGATPPMLDALVDVLLGKARAQGRLPVELSDRAQ